jgi:hypothetical protein
MPHNIKKSNSAHGLSINRERGFGGEVLTGRIIKRLGRYAAPESEFSTKTVEKIRVEIRHYCETRLTPHQPRGFHCDVLGGAS